MSKLSKRTKDNIRQKKKKTVLALIILAIVVLLAAVLIIVSLRRENQKLTEQEQAAQTIQEATDALTNQKPAVAETENSEEQTVTEITPDNGETETDSGEAEQPADEAPEQAQQKEEKKPEQKTPDNGHESQTEDKDPETPAEPVQQDLPVDIAFPYDVPGTTLQVVNVYSYDGVFVEDGSDNSVSGIAVMGLKNTGTKPVEYVSLTLNQNGRSLVFTASDVVAGGYVLVEEANAAPYKEGAYQQGELEIAEVEELGFAPEVSVAENDSGRLVVTNLTDKDIPCVRIFYKLYVESSDTYVGGITYTAKITDLKAGASLTVTPSHYAAGYSRVVMTRVYDSAD